MASQKAAPHRRRQLGAMMWKNSLLKRRAWKTTTCELVSPVLFIGVLVLGYSLSDSDSYPERTHASQTINLGALLSSASNAANIGRPGSNLLELWGFAFELLRLGIGPIPVLSIDVYAGVDQALRNIVGAERYEQLTAQQWLIDSLGLAGNLLNPGTLHFAPNNTATRDFLAFARARHPVLNNVRTRLHATEQVALDYILDHVDDERTWGLVALRELCPSRVDYAVRLNYTQIPNTNLITRFLDRGLETDFQSYVTSGFLTMQALVDEYVFENAATHGTAARYAPPTSYSLAAPMPTAAHNQNQFYSAVSYLLSLCLTMCMLFPVSLLTKAVVEEKELRLKQTMRMMGLQDSVLYISRPLPTVTSHTDVTPRCTPLLAAHPMTGTLLLVVALGSPPVRHHLDSLHDRHLLLHGDDTPVGPLLGHLHLLPRLHLLRFPPLRLLL